VSSYGLILMVTFLLLRSKHACHGGEHSPTHPPATPPTPNTGADMRHDPYMGHTHSDS
jgi:hypothetical protein